jgi:hypothetical protein
MPPVDWTALNRFAYSFVSPSAPNPGAVVRRALLLGDIPLGDQLPISAKARGAGVIVFNTPVARDAAVDGENIPVRQYTVHFERPEETEVEGSFEHGGYVILALEKFPCSIGTRPMSSSPWAGWRTPPKSPRSVSWGRTSPRSSSPPGT